MTVAIAIAMVFGCWIVTANGQTASNITEITRNIGGLDNNNRTTPAFASNSSKTTAPSQNKTTIKPTVAPTDSAPMKSTTETTSETKIPSAVGSQNATWATQNCPSLIPANVGNMSQIQGVWYIQAYTAPSGGERLTQCDEFDISIDVPKRNGKIIYTFIQKGDYHLSTEVAEVTLLPRASQFYYNVSGVDVSMTATILVFRKDEAYVHLACPDDTNNAPTLVIATSQRIASMSVIAELMQEAAEHGASVNVLPVNNSDVDCTLPIHKDPLSA